MLLPRANRTPDGTIIQQSMSVEAKDYNTSRMSRSMLGVVTSVQLSDGGTNRIAAQFADRRGFIHTATVQILDDGGPGGFPLIDVIVTPDERTGVDDYSENMPKAATRLLTGEELNEGHHNIDPFLLDGDWCVVKFLGERYSSPYISRYWPHAGNTFDPATCGEGNPDLLGEGTSLDQAGRKFTRINGVEQIVTRQGDVYLSTTYAGSDIVPGEGGRNGRFSRNTVPDGGSVRLDIKPNQIMELNWNAQEDGIGVGNAHDPQLPQTNPNKSTPFTVLHSGQFQRLGTFIRIGQERYLIEVPEQIRLNSNGRMFLEAAEEISITSREGTLSLDSENVLNLDSRADINLESEKDLNLIGLEAIMSGAGGLDDEQLAIAGKVVSKTDGRVRLGADKLDSEGDLDPTDPEFDPEDLEDAPSKRGLVTDAIAPVWETELTKITASLILAEGAVKLADPPSPLAPTPALNLKAIQSLLAVVDDLKSFVEAINEEFQPDSSINDFIPGLTTFTKAN